MSNPVMKNAAEYIKEKMDDEKVEGCFYVWDGDDVYEVKIRKCKDKK